MASVEGVKKMQTAREEIISMEEWTANLKTAKVSKENLNRLVLNFLVIEGYKDTAEKFAKETKTSSGVDLSSIEDRMVIRGAVHRGEIQDAIERVNDLNPEILETQAGLLFHLQRQRLIEMIRAGEVEHALDFVQDELPALCEDHPEFLAELEGPLPFISPVQPSI